MSHAAFTIDGGAVHDIASLYTEVNRVFMTGEDWVLGESLDALDDLLYGGFGALHGATRPIRIVWHAHVASKRALGRAATAEYYREKLRHPEIFDAKRFSRALADLEEGVGPTYFELVIDVFSAHDDVELVLD